MRNSRRLVALMLMLSAAAYAEVVPPATPVAVTPFAVIGEDSISREEFQAALHESMRRRFFHGAPAA